MCSSGNCYIPFNYQPLDQAYEAINSSVMATEVACSNEWELVVTNQRDGSLRILSVDSFTHLYNLMGFSRAGSTALSPDSRRIYNIRGALFNVTMCVGAKHSTSHGRAGRHRKSRGYVLLPSSMTPVPYSLWRPKYLLESGAGHSHLCYCDKSFFYVWK